jgi:hypothetical protein
MRSRLTIEKHDRLRLALIHAERAAAYACAAIRGRTAEEVALEVASRAIAALCKRQPEGQARP